MAQLKTYGTAYQSFAHNGLEHVHMEYQFESVFLFFLTS